VNNRATPPAVDEFEVSIIGPGRGECVVLHLGNNEWCVVDSCIPQGLLDSVAVHYLNEFRNDALKGVRLIVATHWHDDHIRGLTSILEKAPGASFFCSAALRSEEFSTLVGTAQSGIPRGSGVEEFASVLGSIMEHTENNAARRLATPKFAIENRSLLLLRENGRPFPVSITALSPSDATLKLALMEISKLIPKAGEAQRRITSRSPNHSSVVLWVEAGPMRVLLGADLEHTGNAGEGWMAVLQCHEHRQEAEPAALFKVPHHGSSNADCPDVWPKMLKDSPIAVVTPFNGGRVRLPREADLNRLKERTPSLYCTALGVRKAPRRDAVVEKMMRLELAERRVITGRAGQVRVRWSLTSHQAEPVVDLFDGAYRVRAD
jgi:Metallo-beta-lactamase superfamily